MQRTNFGDMACSIARTLDVIGEPWSPLVLRDVFVGFTRFEQIQADLGISRKVLTERLNHLVEQGVLERLPYHRRPRYEYILTEKGAELVDLLMVMVGWGDKWLAGEACRRCSTAITPAARSAVSTCAARTADSRCTQATSTCFPARARRPDPIGGPPGAGALSRSAPHA